jgi:hypothetical protein
MTNFEIQSVLKIMEGNQSFLKEVWEEFDGTNNGREKSAVEFYHFSKKFVAGIITKYNKQVAGENHPYLN